MLIKWCNFIVSSLNHLGYPYLWSANEIKAKPFKKMISKRLSDINIQNWSNELHGNILCINYRIFQTEFRLPPYFKILDNQPNVKDCTI